MFCTISPSQCIHRICLTITPKSFCTAKLVAIMVQYRGATSSMLDEESLERAVVGVEEQKVIVLLLCEAEVRYS